MCGAHFWNWKNLSVKNYYENVQGHVDYLNQHEGKNYTLDCSKKE